MEDKRPGNCEGGLYFQLNYAKGFKFNISRHYILQLFVQITRSNSDILSIVSLAEEKSEPPSAILVFKACYWSI